MNNRIYTLFALCIVYVSTYAQDPTFIRAQVAYKYGYYDSVLTILSQSNSPKYIELKGKAYSAQHNYTKALQSFTSSETNQSAYEIARVYAIENKVDSSILYLTRYLGKKEKIAYRLIMSDSAFVNMYNTSEWRNIWKQNWYTEQELLLESIDYNFEHKNPQKVIDIVQESGKTSDQIILLQALAYAQLGKKSEALQLYKKIASNESNLLDYRKFELLNELGEYGESYSWLSKFYSSHQNEITYELDLAKLLYQMNEYDKALEHIQKYTSYEYKDASAWYFQSIICETQQRYVDALQAIQKAIAIEPGNADYLFARGNIYLDLKQFGFAEIDYNQSLDLNPQLEVYFNRGQARRYQGNIHGACLDYTRSYKLGNKEALYNKNMYCGKK